MGLNINDSLDYTLIANTLAVAGSRALGELTRKYYKIKGMKYSTYKQIFDSSVLPILNYGCEKWGCKLYQQF